MIRKGLAALAIVAGLGIPSSLEAMMIVPCIVPVEVIRLGPKTEVIKVEEGETLWEICQREYGTPWSYGSIMITNNITDPRELRAGQNLVIYRNGVSEQVVRRGYTEGVCPLIERDHPATQKIYTWE